MYDWEIEKKRHVVQGMSDVAVNDMIAGLTGIEGDFCNDLNSAMNAAFVLDLLTEDDKATINEEHHYKIHFEKDRINIAEWWWEYQNPIVINKFEDFKGDKMKTLAKTICEAILILKGNWGYPTDTSSGKKGE